MAIENTVSSDFYMHSSIVKSVFDCHLPGLKLEASVHFLFFVGLVV